MQKQFLIISLVFGIVGSIHADTWIVGSSPLADFTTIQAAVDASRDGDVVLVENGTYTGEGNRDIDPRGRAITIASVEGPSRCVIDCQATVSSQHRAFLCISGEGIDTVIKGFTLRGGYIDLGAGITPDTLSGGAILCMASDPTIRNCVFEDNHARIGGAVSAIGVGAQPARPSLMNCTFAGNLAYQSGGAIFGQGTQIHLTSSILQDNESMSGSAIQLDATGQLTVRYSDLAEGRTSIDGGDLIWGEGNLEVDPSFVKPGVRDEATLHWTPGDYHLKSTYGRWNGRDWLKDSDTSPCIDGGMPGPEWAEETWYHGMHPNMGAYGSTGHASRSVNILEDIKALPDNQGPVDAYLMLVADRTGDWQVDYRDLKVFTQHWLSVQIPLAADYDGNRCVDGQDLAVQLDNWRPTTLARTKPLPEVVVWQRDPVCVNGQRVEMEVAPAFSTDGTGVEYFFFDPLFPDVINSGWRRFAVGESVVWADTQVAPDGTYSYDVIARNIGNQDAIGADQRAASCIPPVENTPPTPNPAQWELTPRWQGDNIFMKAATATDEDGVEYLFECTNRPEASSTWQDSPSYTATGQPKNANYIFVTYSRDKSSEQLTTEPSTPPFIVSGDTSGPTPDPMEWAENGEPIMYQAVPGSQLTWTFAMIAADARDNSGDVEYFFECLDDGAFSSGWTTNPLYERLVGTNRWWWRFRVKARDGSGNETEWSPATQVQIR
ncbi:hypothetical protein ACFL6U_18845 [Planctomycetota bacterium]